MKKIYKIWNRLGINDVFHWDESDYSTIQALKTDNYWQCTKKKVFSDDRPFKITLERIKIKGKAKKRKNNAKHVSKNTL